MISVEAWCRGISVGAGVGTDVGADVGTDVGADVETRYRLTKPKGSPTCREKQADMDHVRQTDRPWSTQSSDASFGNAKVLASNVMYHSMNQAFTRKQQHQCGPASNDQTANRSTGGESEDRTSHLFLSPSSTFTHLSFVPSRSSLLATIRHRHETPESNDQRGPRGRDRSSEAHLDSLPHLDMSGVRRSSNAAR